MIVVKSAKAYTHEGAIGLIIAHGTWLARDNFACYIHHGDTERGVLGALAISLAALT